MNRKKIAAGFISFALMMQSCVFAVSAAEENKTANFEYDDFSVSYSVSEVDQSGQQGGGDAAFLFRRMNGVFRFLFTLCVCYSHVFLLRF